MTRSLIRRRRGRGREYRGTRHEPTPSPQPRRRGWVSHDYLMGREWVWWGVRRYDGREKRRMGRVTKYVLSVE